MKVGLYFGSFNPIHNGHLIIANFIAQKTDIEQVWFVVSPQNPFKQNANLLNEYHRYHLVQVAIDGEKNLKATDIEFRLPRPSFTVNTLAYLEEKYPNHNFCIIMGSDSFQNLDKWKNSNVIINRYPIYVYRRAGYEITDTLKAKLTIVDAPLLQISATGIREMVKQNLSIRYLVPDAVREEIESNHYYK